MRLRKEITIVGGGLAGLTLGLALRREAVPVTVWETGRYPRHRVCGEFISGHGQRWLERLGLRAALIQAGAATATTAVFFLGPAASPVRALPAPALCLSRFKMDALLAERFVDSGGDLRQGQRWPGKVCGEGMVRASGRRVQPPKNGDRWLGLKVHAVNAATIASLEMHGTRDGYVGICRLNETEVNVCGLFRQTTPGGSPTAGHCRGRSLLRGEPGTPLFNHLRQAEFLEASFCSVAGFSLEPCRAADQPECCLGDALTMVQPVTGNGMSMAFEAAALATGPLAAYSRGEISWSQAQRTIARACDAAFAPRLAWARWLQRMMFTPALRSPVSRLALNSGLLWRFMFARTR